MKRFLVGLVAALLLGVSLSHGAAEPAKPKNPPHKPNAHENLSRLKRDWDLKWRDVFYGVIIKVTEEKDTDDEKAAPAEEGEGKYTLLNLATSEEIVVPRSRMSDRDLEIISEYQSGIIKGKVIGIEDGDTLMLVTDAKRMLRIRLHGIDAPEKAQPFCARAKQRLGELVQGQRVTVYRVGNSFKRITGTVFDAQGENVNLQLIEEGLAWHSPDYWVNEEYEEAFKKAKREKEGLWGGSETAQPPWDYRIGRPAARKTRILSPRFLPVEKELWRSPIPNPRITSPFHHVTVDLHQRPTVVGDTLWLNHNGTLHRIDCHHRNRAGGHFSALGEGIKNCGTCNPDQP
tara:strand:- start:1970 stop:3004 length:1035 start_codon:yes stop_codon:yes gene_type:complete